MKENSIEILENWIEELNYLFNNTHINNTKERKALKDILSDYKRVLKENEQLRTEVNSLLKENERYQEIEIQLLESE